MSILFIRTAECRGGRGPRINGKERAQTSKRQRGGKSTHSLSIPSTCVGQCCQQEIYLYFLKPLRLEICLLHKQMLVTLRQEQIDNATSPLCENKRSPLPTHTQPCEPHYVCEEEKLLAWLIQTVHMINGEYQNSFCVLNLALHHPAEQQQKAAVSWQFTVSALAKIYND